LGHPAQTRLCRDRKARAVARKLFNKEQSRAKIAKPKIWQQETPVQAAKYRGQYTNRDIVQPGQRRVGTDLQILPFSAQP